MIDTTILQNADVFTPKPNGVPDALLHPIDVSSNMSPVPNKKPTELSFPDAIREVLNQKRITRLEWDTNDTFGALHEGFLMIFIRGEWHQWIVNDGDLNAIDWVVLPE